MKTYERTAFARSGPRLRRYRAALVSAAAIGTVVASSVGAQTVLPKADGTGQTQVGPTMAQSAPPQWPELAKAPSGAPNILLIMTDDVGFGATSSFGGPIPTPVLDRLADNGIRYNRFNTTALCSPTRAALLTGRNHHNTNMGSIANFAVGYEGYTSIIPKSAGMIAETLRQNGYSTAAYGKWHLTPEWEQSKAGPFDRWPTGQGFEHYYGFLAGDTNQFAPGLYEGTKAILPPNDKDYVLDRDLADQAIRWMREQHVLAPEKPFFAYFATGTAHAPHSAPAEWLAKFRGKYDQGWDTLRNEIFARQKAQGIIPANAELTPRPADLPAWASLTVDQKKIYARFMEAYAASLSFMDHEVGRILDSLKESGQLDNTLVIFIEGDNGGSGEGGPAGLIDEHSMFNGIAEKQEYVLKHLDEIGGPTTYNLYPAGWAWALNTPFQHYKQVASHFGGIRNGLVVSWPNGIKPQGKVASQFLHVTDIVPTILEVARIPQPDWLNGVKQKPLDGMSFAYTFKNPSASGKPRTQVFEILQNIGIYKDGWWAGTRPIGAPWDVFFKPEAGFENRTWELYNVDEDFSQAHDLATRHPKKLEELKSIFVKEAANNHIFPIHGAVALDATRPSLSRGRTAFRYYSGMTRIPEENSVSLIGKSYTISASVSLPSGPANGVIVAKGGRFGGYSLYLHEGRVAFHYNATADNQYKVETQGKIGPGDHAIEVQFTADSSAPGSGGLLRIKVDGKPAASGRIELTHKGWISITEGLDIGEDTLTPVTSAYSVEQSRFTGKIDYVDFRLSGAEK